MALSELEALQLEQLRREQLRRQSKKVTPKAKDSSEGLAILGGLGAAAAVGGTGYLANKMFIKPYGEYREANKGLRAIGKDFGIDPRISPGEIPRALGDYLSQTRLSNQADLSNVRAQSVADIKNISKSLYDLDTGIIGRSSDDLANFLKSKWPEINKVTIEAYGRGLDAIDKMADAAGFNISNQQIISNFLDNVIEDAEKSGIDQKQIKGLMSTRDALKNQSKILSIKGLPVESKLSLSDAKSIVSNLTREDPYSPLSAKIREGWANFLEREAPKEIKPLYQSLNENYKPYTEARNLINKLSDPKTGVMDARGLSRYISDYTKKGTDAGISNLIKITGEGNALVPSSPEILEKFNNISNLQKSRIQVVDSLKKAQGSSALKINTKQQENIQKIQKILEAKSKANNLASIASDANAKFNPVKGLVRFAVGKVPRLLAGVPAGIVEGELQKRAVGYDPIEGIDAILINAIGNEKEKAELREKAKKAYFSAMEI